MDKTYSSKSNARRAAKDLGVLDQVDIVPLGGRFTLSWKKAEVKASANPCLVGTRPETKPEPSTDPLLLATEDEDLGLVSAETAEQDAAEAANETGQTVTVRDPITDKVLHTAEPVIETDANGEPVIPDFLRRGKPTPEEEAQMAKDIATLEKQEREAKKKKREQQKAATAARKSNAAPKRKRADGPSDKVKEIIRLACRKNGVSPQELNEAIKWKGAPWKWLFSNKNKTGYAEKFGYKFWVEKADGVTRYHLEKKA